MKKEKLPVVEERLNKVGGEAVLEGVMMKAGDTCPTAVRMPDGAIRVLPGEFHSVRKKHKFLNLPLIRGSVSFVESMKLSMQVMTRSAEAVVEEDIKESKADAWCKKHLGFSLLGAVEVFSMFLGILLALTLFIYLPNLASSGLEVLISWIKGSDFSLGVWKAVTSGIIKIGIFILYIYLIGLLPDIRKTFEYHGSEHKTICCFERGWDLTPENAKKCTRFHPRCGTSFMFVMILLGVVLSLATRIILESVFLIDFEVLTGSKLWESLIYTGIGLLLLPLIMGLGFEFLMFAGKHSDKWYVRILSAPGLWMQRLTTREPSLEELEVAIAATKYALPEFFPDFDRETYASQSGFKAEKCEESKETQ